MTRLPYHASPSQAADAARSSDLEIVVLPEVFTRLQHTARRIAVPLKSVLLATHLRVLSLLSNQPEVLTGLVVHGRPEGPDAERVLGMFLHVMPLQLRLPTNSWKALIQATFQAEQALLPWRHYPIAHQPENKARLPRFETVFNFVHFHVYQGLSGLKNFEYLAGEFFDPFPYTLKANFIVNPLSAQLMLNLNYNKNVIYEELLLIISQYYTKILTTLSPESLEDLVL
jgi:microcystin synthetase protein McyA